MLSGNGNENVGLFSKKQFARAAQFFEHFFAVVLQDYHGVKLPETSWSHVLWRIDVVCAPVILCFSLPLFFILVTTSISHFL